MVMADKHFLGIPLLEGSLWRSPRIPPPFAIKAICGGEYGFLSKIERHPAPTILSTLHPLGVLDPSVDAQPSQGSLLSLGTSSTTVLLVSRPLGVEDHFSHQSLWLEQNYMSSMILFLLLFVFLGIVIRESSSPLTRSQAPTHPQPRFPEPFPGSSLADDMEFQKFWDFMLGEQGIAEMQEGVKVEEERAPEEKGQEESGQEAEIRQEEGTRQENKIKEVGMDATVHRAGGKGHGSEAGEGDGKEGWEGKAKIGIKEDEWIDIHENAENTGLNESPVKGKKRRVRQNAKRRAAAKKAATGEKREDEPVASDTLAMAEDEGKDNGIALTPKVTGKGFVLPVSSDSTLRVPAMTIDYTKKKNFELEAVLKARSLPHTGKKAVLIARLQKYDAEKVDDESDWEDEGAIVEPNNATAIGTGGSDQPKKPTAMPKQVVKIDPSNANVLTNASKAAEADKGTTGAAIAGPGHQRSVLQNEPTISGPFTGFGHPSAGATNARPDHQRSILQNVPTISESFIGFGQPSSGATDTRPIIQGPMFRRKAPLPAPVPLGINGKSGGIPLQDAVTAAMKQATGDKKEEKKPTIGFRRSSFESRPMQKR